MVKVTSEMLSKLPKSKYRSRGTVYDSDETVLYYPVDDDKPYKAQEVLLDEGINMSVKPKRWVIKAHPSCGGFSISVHGVRKRKSRTCLDWKERGCKARFPSVRDWNSYHCRMHNGVKLQCENCGKLFKTPSFLRDHRCEHSECKFVCEKCNKCFVFKSTHRIHRYTHLRVKIHKCFAGSCDREYKWPQDLHRHIQVHLKRNYGCSVCDYTNSQKYLLKTPS